MADFGNLLKVAKIGCPFGQAGQEENKMIYSDREVIGFAAMDFLFSRWFCALNSIHQARVTESIHNNTTVTGQGNHSLEVLSGAKFDPAPSLID